MQERGCSAWPCTLMQIRVKTSCKLLIPDIFLFKANGIKILKM